VHLFKDEVKLICLEEKKELGIILEGCSNKYFLFGQWGDQH